MNRSNKTISLIGPLMLLLIVMISCNKEAPLSSTDQCKPSFPDSSAKHPKAAEYQNIIDHYTDKGLPGIVLLIRDTNGLWINASGKADIEKDIDMKPCTVSKIASITKLFMGTLVMKLVEEGQLSLDAKLTSYIDGKVIQKIENAKECTLRQLLNHTSGIYDVISDREFYLELLNHPDKVWDQEELLSYTYDKPAEFETGTDAGYSNTNFILVSMVIEEATGRDHATLLHKKIIQPLGLNHTYYYHHDNLPAHTAQGYFDLYNNGTIMQMTHYNTGSGNGYGGIYSTVNDLKIFIEALLKDKTLLDSSSLNTMLTWTKENQEEHRRFGLGIFKDFLERPPEQYGWGHRGRDLAYSGDCYYFPENNTTMAYLVNYGTNGESKLRPLFFRFRERIADEIFE